MSQAQVSKVRAVFAAALDIKNKQDKRDETFKAFVRAWCPTSYEPFVEHDHFTGFMEGIKAMNENLHSEFSWFFYDISQGKRAMAESGKPYEINTVGGKTYQINGPIAFADYLEAEYPNV